LHYVNQEESSFLLSTLSTVACKS